MFFRNKNCIAFDKHKFLFHNIKIPKIIFKKNKLLGGAQSKIIKWNEIINKLDKMITQNKNNFISFAFNKLFNYSNSNKITNVSNKINRLLDNINDIDSYIYNNYSLKLNISFFHKWIYINDDILYCKLHELSLLEKVYNIIWQYTLFSLDKITFTEHIKKNIADNNLYLFDKYFTWFINSILKFLQ